MAEINLKEFGVSPEVPVYRVIILRRKFNTNSSSPNGLDLAAFGFPTFLPLYLMMSSDKFAEEVKGFTARFEKIKKDTGYEVIVLDPMLHNITDKEDLYGFHGFTSEIVTPQNLTYAPALDLSFTLGEAGKSSLSLSFIDRDGIFFKPLSLKIEPPSKFSDEGSISKSVKEFYQGESTFKDFISYFREIGLFDELFGDISDEPGKRMGYYFVPPLTPIAVDVYSQSQKKWIRVFSGVVTGQSYDITFRNDVRYKVDAMSFGDMLYKHTELVDSLFGNFLLTFISSSVKNVKEVPIHVSAMVIALSIVKYVRSLDYISNNLTSDFRGFSLSRNSSLFQYVEFIHRTANVVFGTKFLDFKDLAYKFILMNRSSIVSGGVSSLLQGENIDNPAAKVLKYLKSIGEDFLNKIRIIDNEFEDFCEKEVIENLSASGVKISENNRESFLSSIKEMVKVLYGAIAIYNYFVYRFSPLVMFDEIGGLFSEVDYDKLEDGGKENYATSFSQEVVANLDKDIWSKFLSGENYSSSSSTVSTFFRRVGIKTDNAILRLINTIAKDNTSTFDELFKFVFRAGLADSQISLYSDSLLKVSEVFENIRQQLGLHSFSNNYGDLVLYIPRLFPEIISASNEITSSSKEDRLKILYENLYKSGVSNKYRFYGALPSNIQEKERIFNGEEDKNSIIGNIFVLDPLSGVTSVNISNNYTNSISKAKIGLNWDFVEFSKDISDLLFTIPAIDPALYFQTKGSEEITVSMNFITRLQKIMSILSSLKDSGADFILYIYEACSSESVRELVVNVSGSSGYKMFISVDKPTALVLKFILKLLGIDLDSYKSELGEILSKKQDLEKAKNESKRNTIANDLAVKKKNLEEKLNIGQLSSFVTIFPYIYLVWAMLIKNIENNSSDFSIYRADPVNLSVLGNNVYIPHSNWVGVVREVSYSIHVGGAPDLRCSTGYMVPLPYLQFFPPISIAEFLALTSIMDINFRYETKSVSVSGVKQGVSDDWVKNKIIKSFILELTKYIGDNFVEFYNAVEEEWRPKYDLKVC